MPVIRPVLMCVLVYRSDATLIIINMQNSQSTLSCSDKILKYVQVNPKIKTREDFPPSPGVGGFIARGFVCSDK